MIPRTHTSHPTPHTHRASRLGFSLVELLVVIVIIVTIVGLALAGINIAYQRSEEADARVLLASLAGIEKEYRAQTSTPVPPSAKGDLDDATNIHGFHDVAQDNDVTANMLRQLSKTALTYDGTRITAVKDPWGVAIIFNHGTGKESAGLPKQRYPYFASAGPDGDWGTYTNNTPDDDAKDNLYSFEVK